MQSAFGCRSSCEQFAGRRTRRNNAVIFEVSVLRGGEQRCVRAEAPTLVIMAVDGFGDGIYRGSAAMQLYPRVVRIAIDTIDYVDTIDNVQMLENVGDIVTGHASRQVQNLN